MIHAHPRTYFWVGELVQVALLRDREAGYETQRHCMRASTLSLYLTLTHSFTHAITTTTQIHHFSGGDHMTPVIQLTLPGFAKNKTKRLLSLLSRSVMTARRQLQNS